MPDGWESAGLTDITIPGDAGPADPRIYVGQNDPLAQSIGQDAAIVFYYADGRAFLISVEQSGSPDYGQLHISTIDEVNGLKQLVDIDSDVALNRAYFRLGQGVGSLVDLFYDGASNEFGSPVRFRENVTIDTANSISDADGLTYLKGQIGTETVSFGASIFVQIPIVFPTPFPAGVVPVVTTNITSVAGSVRWWMSKARDPTNTGFSLIVQTTDAARAAEAWVNIPVQWSAVAPG